MDTKQKFVRLKEYNEVIIFPCVIEHSRFKHFNPISAGFCYVNADKERVDCFGESYSLDLKSDPKKDTIEATKQIFGIDACLKLLGSNGL
jgi:hypothetical protein